MPKMRVEGITGTIQGLVDGLKKAKSNTAPKIERAVGEWVDKVEQDARAGLARPKWILSKNIGSKIKNYDNKKVWAMAGFKFHEKNDKRDPGYYGKFHEAGWAPKGHKVTAPEHFLRKAKQKHFVELERKIDEIGLEIKEIIRKEI